MIRPIIKVEWIKGGGDWYKPARTGLAAVRHVTLECGHEQRIVMPSWNSGE